MDTAKTAKMVKATTPKAPKTTTVPANKKRKLKRYSALIKKAHLMREIPILEMPMLVASLTIAFQV